MPSLARRGPTSSYARSVGVTPIRAPITATWASAAFHTPSHGLGHVTEDSVGDTRSNVGYIAPCPPAIGLTVVPRASGGRRGVARKRSARIRYASVPR